MHAAPFLCAPREARSNCVASLGTNTYADACKHTHTHSVKEALNIAIKALVLACHPHFSSLTSNHYDEGFLYECQSIESKMRRQRKE